MHGSKFKIQKWTALLCILNFAFLIAGCGVPNLEPVECNEARSVVRELYSFHFGNEMRPSLENIELRSRFLTSKFKEFVRNSFIAGHDAKAGDEFTKTVNDFPKAFRVGKCTLQESKSKAQFEVLLFWKDDKRTEQRTLHVVTKKDSGKWLVDDIALVDR